MENLIANSRNSDGNLSTDKIPSDIETISFGVDADGKGFSVKIRYTPEDEGGEEYTFKKRIGIEDFKVIDEALTELYDTRGQGTQDGLMSVDVDQVTPAKNAPKELGGSEMIKG